MNDDLREIAGLLKDTQDMARSVLSPTATGNATINVNAGGLGVWVSTICAVVCLVVCGFLGYLLIGLKADLTELRQKDDAFQAYINMGLVKPAEEEK